MQQGPAAQPHSVQELNFKLFDYLAKHPEDTLENFRNNIQPIIDTLCLSGFNFNGARNHYQESLAHKLGPVCLQALYEHLKSKGIKLDLTAHDNHQNMTPLHNACFAGQVDKVAFLLNSKQYTPDLLNQTSETGLSAAECAAAFPNPILSKKMLAGLKKAGADTECDSKKLKNCVGQNLLHRAAWDGKIPEGTPQELQRMLEETDASGRTPMAYFLHSRRTAQVCQALNERLINLTASASWTPALDAMRQAPDEGQASPSPASQTPHHGSPRI